VGADLAEKKLDLTVEEIWQSLCSNPENTALDRLTKKWELAIKDDEEKA
jgi:hypothetical protein